MRSRTVVWLTVGGENVASSRVRAHELSDELRSRGWTSRVVVGAGVRGRLAAAAAILRVRPSAVVFQKLFPARLTVRALKYVGVTVVFECDDAVHLGYPGTSEGEREAIARRVSRTVQEADIVTTTPTLVGDFSNEARRVVAFAGPAPRLEPRNGPPTPKQKIAVWVGSPSTTKHLCLLGDFASRLRAAGWDCVAIGATPTRVPAGWRTVDWSVESAGDWLARAAVGVMPQLSSPWDDRKAGYKLLEYAAAGAVPLASAVPPARLLLNGEALESLLISGGTDEWVRAAEFAWESVSAWRPILSRLVEVHGVAAAADVWETAVTESGSSRG